MTPNEATSVEPATAMLAFHEAVKARTATSELAFEVARIQIKHRNPWQALHVLRGHHWSSPQVAAGAWGLEAYALQGDALVLWGDICRGLVPVKNQFPADAHRLYQQAIHYYEAAGFHGQPFDQARLERCQAILANPVKVGPVHAPANPENRYP